MAHDSDEHDLCSPMRETYIHLSPNEEGQLRLRAGSTCGTYALMPTVPSDLHLIFIFAFARAYIKISPQHLVRDRCQHRLSQPDLNKWKIPPSYHLSKNKMRKRRINSTGGTGVKAGQHLTKANVLQTLYQEAEAPFSVPVSR